MDCSSIICLDDTCDEKIPDAKTDHSHVEDESVILIEVDTTIINIKDSDEEDTNVILISDNENEKKNRFRRRSRKRSSRGSSKSRYLNKSLDTSVKPFKTKTKQEKKLSSPKDPALKMSTTTVKSLMNSFQGLTCTNGKTLNDGVKEKLVNSKAKFKVSNKKQRIRNRKKTNIAKNVSTVLFDMQRNKRHATTYNNLNGNEMRNNIAEDNSQNSDTNIVLSNTNQNQVKLMDNKASLKFEPPSTSIVPDLKQNYDRINDNKQFRYYMTEDSAIQNTENVNRTDLQLQPVNVEVNSNLVHQSSQSNISNIYHEGNMDKTGLRPIIIDGSNVAMGHSKNRFFSVKGLKICIDYFLKRKHRVYAFIPNYRMKYSQSSDPQLLNKLLNEGLVVCTASREVNGKRITSYDDRMFLQVASEMGGIVISNDNFRDLQREDLILMRTIQRQVLMFTWVDDLLIFPNDPLGRSGPNLNRFLSF